MNTPSKDNKDVEFIQKIPKDITLSDIYEPSGDLKNQQKIIEVPDESSSPIEISYPGGVGGLPGGIILIVARIIVGSGKIQARGAPGSPGHMINVHFHHQDKSEKMYVSGGGGGGSGGTIIIYCHELPKVKNPEEITDGITLDVSGGPGGEGFSKDTSFRAESGSPGFIYLGKI
jgi:hypothetical protein